MISIWDDDILWRGAAVLAGYTAVVLAIGVGIGWWIWGG